MTDAELRTWAEAHAPAGSPLAVGILRVLTERDALTPRIERGAGWVSDGNAVLSGDRVLGMLVFATTSMKVGAQLLDAAKAERDRLAAELADARRVCESLAERCAGQAELIAARASKDTTTQ